MFFKEMGPKKSKSILSGGNLNGNDLTIEKNAKNPVFLEFKEFKWIFNGYNRKKIVQCCKK